MIITSIHYSNTDTSEFTDIVKSTDFDAMIVMDNKYYYNNNHNYILQYNDDVGMDIVNTENIKLNDLENTPKIIKSGVKTFTKPSLYFEVRPRSSLHKYGLIVANSPGTIDPQYRGEIGMILVKLFNHTKDIPNNVIKSGTRLCQLVLKPYIPLLSYDKVINDFSNQIKIGIFYSNDVFNNWETLLKSDRGGNGYGSTDG